MDDGRNFTGIRIGVQLNEHLSHIKEQMEQDFGRRGISKSEILGFLEGWTYKQFLEAYLKHLQKGLIEKGLFDGLIK